MDKKQFEDLLELKNEYFDVVDGISRREGEEKKSVEFGWNVYQDSPDAIHIPFDSEMRIANEYDLKFKWIDVSMIGLIKPSSYRNGNVSFQIFESWENGKLSDENMLFDSTIGKAWATISGKVKVNVRKERLSWRESENMVKKATKYLGNYFGYEELRKTEDRIDEIQFEEMKSVMEEGDPEELLEQMDWSVWL